MDKAPQRASGLEENLGGTQRLAGKPILWAITGGNQQPRAVPLVELIFPGCSA